MNTREKIVDVFLQNPDFTQKKISKITGASLSTVKRCIRNYKLNLPLAKKPNGGRPTGPVDKNLEREALKLFQREPLDSTRDLARKLGTSTSMIQRIKERNGYKSLDL